jgi:hypothetical protein
MLVLILISVSLKCVMRFDNDVLNFTFPSKIYFSSAIHTSLARYFVSFASNFSQILFPNLNMQMANSRFEFVRVLMRNMREVYDRQ